MSETCSFCRQKFILGLIYEEDGKKFCCKECADDEALNSYYETVSDYWCEPQPKEIFSLDPSPFDITELQYLRGLIFVDKLTNNYVNAGTNALIAENKTMHEFTEEVMKKIDELEEKLCGRGD